MFLKVLRPTRWKYSTRLCGWIPSTSSLGSLSGRSIKKHGIEAISLLYCCDLNLTTYPQLLYDKVWPSGTGTIWMPDLRYSADWIKGAQSNTDVGDLIILFLSWRDINNVIRLMHYLNSWITATTKPLQKAWDCSERRHSFSNLGSINLLPSRRYFIRDSFVRTLKVTRSVRVFSSPEQVLET